MAWNKGSTTRARAAQARYRLRKGLYAEDHLRHYSKLERDGITIGPMPRRVVEKQQQTLRNKRMKVTLPTIKEP